jgi:molybdopterin biosynthesis enzyme
MSLPVIELIAQNVLTTVQGVTEENGYNYTITATRHAKKGDKRTNFAAIILQADPREATDENVYNTKEWWLPFEISVFIIPSDTDTTPIDTYCNVVRSDIEQALMADRYRGGVARDTEIKASRAFTEETSAYDVIIVNCEVNYRTQDINPYAIAL